MKSSHPQSNSRLLLATHTMHLRRNESMREPGEHGEDPDFQTGNQVIRGKGMHGGRGQNAGALQGAQRESLERHLEVCVSSEGPLEGCVSLEGHLEGWVSQWHCEGAPGDCANTSWLVHGQPCPYLYCQRDESRNWLNPRSWRQQKK